MKTVLEILETARKKLRENEHEFVCLAIKHQDYNLSSKQMKVHYMLADWVEVALLGGDTMEGMVQNCYKLGQTKPVWAEWVWIQEAWEMTQMTCPPHQPCHKLRLKLIDHMIDLAKAGHDFEQDLPITVEDDDD